MLTAYVVIYNCGSSMYSEQFPSYEEALEFVEDEDEKAYIISIERAQDFRVEPHT